MRIPFALFVAAAIAGLTVVATDAIERRRVRGRLTLVTERDDDALTILAKRQAERRRQCDHDSHSWT